MTLVVSRGRLLRLQATLFSTFDPEIAPVYGVPTEWVETGFSLALAATVVASMNVVGVTLIAAAVVIPPITARLLTDSFGTLVILSTVLGALFGAAGIFLSYQFDVASGAAIVLLSAAVFGAVYAITTLRRRLSLGMTATRPVLVPLGTRTPAANPPDGHLFD